jgi:hypothetical protein
LNIEFSCAETLGGPKEQFLIVNQGQTILKVPLTASGLTTGGENRILYVPRKSNIWKVFFF